jgi:hypothetical protein
MGGFKAHGQGCNNTKTTTKAIENNTTTTTEKSETTQQVRQNFRIFASYRLFYGDSATFNRHCKKRADSYPKQDEKTIPSLRTFNKIWLTK